MAISDIVDLMQITVCKKSDEYKLCLEISLEMKKTPHLVPILRKRWIIEISWMCTISY